MQLVPGALVAALVGVPLAAQGGPQVHTVPDAWSPSVEWRAPDGFYTTALHATLMPDGRILFVGFERDAVDPALVTVVRTAAYVMAPHPAGAPLPGDVVVQHVEEAVDFDLAIVPPLVVADSLNCAGNTLLADGRLFTAGGTRYVGDYQTGASTTLGLPYATVSDGTSWSRVPADMVAGGPLGTSGRWYPSCTRLPDGRVLVVSGLEMVDPMPVLNLSAEVFDPASGTWQLASPLGATPLQIHNGDYTHPFVLPSAGGHDVVMLGQYGYAAQLSLAAPATWSISAQPRPGTLPGELPGNGATTAPLPIRLDDGEWGYSNGSLLTAGGMHATSHLTHADVYDPVADSWSARIPLGVPRHHGTAVLLPDARMLLVAGHDKLGDPNVRRAQYVDPAGGRFAVSIGRTEAGEMRGYHNVALLLPDGRVLVGGGRDATSTEQSEEPSFRYYYPSYFFRPRPVLVGAPGSLDYGAPFTAQTVGAPPAEAVLVGLGSMTHSFDFNQRHVELAVREVSPVAPGVFTSTVVAPPDARVAPPGHYMLFLLDAQRTPTQAAIVHVD